MTDSPAWPAPAKINRFLHVVGRRADGYHELETAFQFIDLCDELTFKPTDGDIEVTGAPAGLAAADNLVHRAAERLRAAAGVTVGARIHLTKRIPAGGGLGGGSSDAATTLVALNRLWGLGLGEDALAGIALGLGADCPVFVRGRAAWAEGVGERLTPIEPDTPWAVVIDPGVSVSTRSVFEAPELTRDTPRTKIRDLAAGALGNDCEPVVRVRHPEVGAALDWLARFGRARLSGTGGCLFALTSTGEEARRIAALSPWRAWAVRTLNRSPLLEC